ncbi:hypothetical protein XENOCAPTIV_028766 [Xenoophorus captivus]|uniref:Uncharacterized protein n=1 Tax=Xenoophorus captivus TaxID=1517983 RepID=A0ABV0QTS2_9TELE
MGTPEVMLSGQIIPHPCQVISETNSLIPQRTLGVPIRLIVKKGQKLQSTRVFFQPLPYYRELNLVVCGTPMLELSNRSTYLLVENPTQVPIQSVFSRHSRHDVLATKSICGATLGAEGNLVVYTLAAHPEEPASAEPGTQDSTSEPYPGFETKVNEQLEKADALSTEVERTALKKLFYEYQSVLSKDSHDCGVTDLHTVRTPTNPNAPPIFVDQYKIPLAAYESIQEILDKLLEKQFNSIQFNSKIRY